MWMWRRTVRVKWTDRLRNKIVFEKTPKQRYCHVCLAVRVEVRSGEYHILRTRITSLYRAHLGQKAWVDITARLEKPTYYGRNDHNFKIKCRKQKTDVDLRKYNGVIYSYADDTVILFGEQSWEGTYINANNGLQISQECIELNDCVLQMIIGIGEMDGGAVFCSPMSPVSIYAHLMDVKEFGEGGENDFHSVAFPKMCRDNFVLMHYNARPHIAHAVGDYLQEVGIHVLPLAARGPDMNPIEHVWNMLGRRVKNRRPRPESLQELRRALGEEWELIPQEYIANQIESMPRGVDSTTTTIKPDKMNCLSLIVTNKAKRSLFYTTLPLNRLCGPYQDAIATRVLRSSARKIVSNVVGESLVVSDIGYMSKQMVRCWCRYFSAGRQNVHDEERSERPQTTLWSNAPSACS
ncbi:hypothetical protein ANN_10426 [Periplaneta americana]|uniref:Tc1-like transposase DDE domain-containing protein n=1 Tax=Periplaneta americana TaxID=6978 RepID=A0ABQ8TSV3_PERAM|nr:hypothetical protein ANN_10426 [Periplaneta americana]